MQNKTLHYNLEKMETTKVLLGNQESKEKKIEILRTILKKKILTIKIKTLNKSKNCITFQLWSFQILQISSLIKKMKRAFQEWGTSF